LTQGTPEDYWREVQVPYVPFYAYREILAAFGDRGKDVYSMLASAERLTSHLTGGAVSEFFESQEDVPVENVLAAYAGEPLTASPAERQNRIAENAVTRLAEQEQAPARRALLRLVAVGSNTTDGDTRRRLPTSNFDPQTRALLNRLSEYGVVLLSRDEKTGDESVELSSAELLRGWQRLRGWLDNDRAFLLWRQGLEADLERWEHSGSPEDLLRGSRLGAARQQLALYSAELSLEERRYINESVKAEEQRRQRAEEEERQREEKERQRREEEKGLRRRRDVPAPLRPTRKRERVPPAQDEMQGLVREATDILRGTYRKPAEILALAKGLKRYKQFGYARRILARARKDPAVFTEPKRLEIFQQSALCTYKDPDLPADSRLDRALEILREVEDLSATRNQETLGLVGAINASGRSTTRGRSSSARSSTTCAVTTKAWSKTRVTRASTPPTSSTCSRTWRRRKPPTPGSPPTAPSAGASRSGAGRRTRFARRSSSRSRRLPTGPAWIGSSARGGITARSPRHTSASALTTRGTTTPRWSCSGAGRRR
jgi:hypothetical protein